MTPVFDLSLRDGFNKEGGTCGQMDCDDGDRMIHPGVAEICTDRSDNNCNDMIDARDPNAVRCPSACTDNDGDDYSVEGGPCGPLSPCREISACIRVVCQ